MTSLLQYIAMVGWTLWTFFSFSGSFPTVRYEELTIAICRNGKSTIASELLESVIQCDSGINCVHDDV